MFEDLIGRHVKVVKKDDFVKRGLLLSTDNSFLKLQFDDGSTVYIALTDVSQVYENGGGRHD
jgi:hypothetical protein